jgi:hypothetical protein
MTLIITEFHLLDRFNNTFILAAADRLFTDPNGKHCTGRKLFDIHYLHGAISFFGIAKFTINGKNTNISDHLETFINNNPNLNSLESFSKGLWHDLNSFIPSKLISENPMGLQICGYDHRGYPDLWYIQNYETLDNFQYGNLSSKFHEPQSHFLGHGPEPAIDWNEIYPSAGLYNAKTFRNGDFRFHELTSYLNQLYINYSSNFADIKKLEPWELLYTKFQIIAYLSKKWAKRNVIGRDIDMLIIKKDKSEWYKPK